MTISASEIVDAESFKEWLKDKPIEVGQVIASRCALRVMPIAFDIWKEDETLLSLNEKAQITLACFRANLISFIHNRYSGVNLRNFGNPAAVIADASVSSVENDAAFVAASASSAVSAISVVDKRAVEARAVSAVSYSCVAFSTTFVHGSSWKIVEQDALWLEDSELYTQALILHPLFIYTGELLKEFWDFREKIFNFWQEFNTFALNNAPEELRRPLTFIAAWYGAILPAQGEVQSLLGEQLDVKLATQSEEFWEGDPIEALNRVADLVGWKGSKTAAETETIEEPVEANSLPPELTDADDALSGKVDSKNIARNHLTVTLSLKGILTSIENERTLLGEQPNEVEKQIAWLQYSRFLEQIEKNTQDALDLLLDANESNTKTNDVNLAELLTKGGRNIVSHLCHKAPEFVEEVLNSGGVIGYFALLSSLGFYTPLAAVTAAATFSSDKTWKRIIKLFPDILRKEK